MNNLKQFFLLVVLIATTNIFNADAQLQKDMDIDAGSNSYWVDKANSKLQKDMVLDKIIARVGRMEVMQSDVDARLLMAKANQQAVSNEPVQHNPLTCR